MSDIILPKTTGDGKPYISYSQINKWTGKKGFNLSNVPGKYEYIQGYFLGTRFEDTMGWGEFGRNVEDAIETRDFSKFSKKEAEVLKKVDYLPVFQKELLVDFGEFSLMLKIDNCTEDMSHIWDFKTGSENSIKQYYTDSYRQLDVYALAVKKETGKMPKGAKVVGIIREGNPFRGEQLKVADKPLRYIPREINMKKLKKTEKWITDTVEDISEWYKFYQTIS